MSAFFMARSGPLGDAPLRRLLRMALLAGGGSSGSYYTLTGTLPLTLPHSLAAAIRSLVRTGAMTQTPAPTPDAPVYPVINNGAVQMVDPDLPAGYKRLTGITFDGDFYYETGEYLTSADDVTMTLDNLSTSGKNLFGSFSSGSGRNFSMYIYGSSSSGAYFRFGNQLKRPVYGGTGRRTITFGAGGTSGFAEDASVDPDEFTTPANVYIGMLSNSSSPAYSGDIVGSVLVGNRLEWIPCESDGGVIGYYERVKGNFIAPTGDGTPVSLGYDNSHLVPRVVGDTEVLSVGGNLLSRDGETTRKIINTDGTVSDNANYCISAPFVLPAGNYACAWNYGSAGTRPFSVFACDADGTPKTDGRIFYQARAEEGINTGEFTVEAETLVVASYRNNATDLAIYSHAQTATVSNLYAVGDYADEVDVVAGTVTRRVGMHVFDGTENFVSLSGNRLAFVMSGTFRNRGGCVCTHFPSASGPSDTTLNTVYAWGVNMGGDKPAIWFRTTDYTASTLKTLCAEQFAAGTPLIAWFVLQEPTTESVTPQALRSVDGTTIVSSSAGSVGATVEYKASEEPANANATALMMAAPSGEDGGAADGS